MSARRPRRRCCGAVPALRAPGRSPHAAWSRTSGCASESAFRRSDHRPQPDTLQSPSGPTTRQLTAQTLARGAREPPRSCRLAARSSSPRHGRPGVIVRRRHGSPAPSSVTAAAPSGRRRANRFSVPMSMARSRSGRRARSDEAVGRAAWADDSRRPDLELGGRVRPGPARGAAHPGRAAQAPTFPVVEGASYGRVPVTSSVSSRAESAISGFPRPGSGCGVLRAGTCVCAGADGFSSTPGGVRCGQYHHQGVHLSCADNVLGAPMIVIVGLVFLLAGVVVGVAGVVANVGSERTSARQWVLGLRLPRHRLHRRALPVRHRRGRRGAARAQPASGRRSPLLAPRARRAPTT